LRFRHLTSCKLCSKAVIAEHGCDGGTDVLGAAYSPGNS